MMHVSNSRNSTHQYYADGLLELDGVFHLSVKVQLEPVPDPLRRNEMPGDWMVVEFPGGDE